MHKANPPFFHRLQGRSARLMVAIATFGGLIICVALILRSEVPKPLQKYGGQLDDATAEQALFYKSIGQTEALERSSKDPASRPDTISNNASGIGPDNGPGEGFTVEIKIAESRQEAEQVIELLRERSVEAYYTPLNQSGRIVYRVRLGVFSKRLVAEQVAAKLRLEQKVAARVTTL